MKKYHIVALGECLVDFTGSEADGALHLVGNAGGAPANVLAAGAALGLSTAFIGKVGQDGFGAFLRASLVRAGIDTAGLGESPHPTTLAMVTLAPGGERSFAFYRTATADTHIFPGDIPALCQDCRVFHFGSLSLTDEPARSATFSAVERAAQSGAVISYDPNYRPALWPGEKEACAAMARGLSLARWAKLSMEEAVLLTGEGSPASAARVLFAQNKGLALLALTLGPGGAHLFTRGGTGYAPAFDLPVVDTTGAGDAFTGALLYRLLAMNLDDRPGGEEALSAGDLAQTARFCCAAGSLSACRPGALFAMAGADEIARCLATENTLPPA